jgi:hypothetical protein
MENSTIALGVATLVVIVLLMSCWEKPKETVPKTKYPPRQRRVRRPPPACYQVREEAVQDLQMPRYGQGKKKMQLDQQYESLKHLEQGDYDTVVQYMSLDPEVFESHSNYSNDIGIANRGASSMTVRSDSNDIVPWVGLFRPDYHSVYADPTSRTDHSQFVGQMEKTRRIKW